MFDKKIKKQCPVCGYIQKSTEESWREQTGHCAICSQKNLISEMILMTEQKQLSLDIKFRLGQALCLGILALGIAMSLGDYSNFIVVTQGLKVSPVNPLSITATVFGAIGTIATEVMARMAKKW